MRLPLVLLVTLACLSRGRARAEDDAKTYDLNTWNAVWKAGDTATVKDDEASTVSVETTQPAAEGKEKTEKHEQVEHETCTYVVKCLEADEHGHSTKALVHLSAWTHAGSTKVDGQETVPDPDTSLQGLHLEVTASDGVHAYTVLTPDAKPSDAGKAWLEKTFGGKQKGRWLLDLDLLGRPEGPVRAGDSWKGDPSKLDFPFPLDAKESTVKVTLAGVEGGRMRLPIAMRFRVTGFPLGNEVLAPFKEGGVFENDSTMTHSLAPHTFDYEGQFVSSLKGTAAIEGAVKIVLALTHHGQAHAVTGGEMPAPPKPADAPK